MSDVPVRIIRQHRRAMMMRVVPGAIEVYIPSRYQETDKCVVHFMKKNLPKAQALALPEPPHHLTEADILQLVADYQQQMSVQPQRVVLREMHRKWGSCSALGTVTLNLRLRWLERPLVEYVVCHELAHLIELNHSAAFWQIVATYLPDYKARIQRLRAAERSFYDKDTQ
ncbi:M48 family metallopeptidase [Aggregatilineales bacterium SYSU G02658]